MRGPAGPRHGGEYPGAARTGRRERAIAKVRDGGAHPHRERRRGRRGRRGMGARTLRGPGDSTAPGIRRDGRRCAGRRGKGGAGEQHKGESDHPDHGRAHRSGACGAVTATRREITGRRGVSHGLHRSARSAGQGRALTGTQQRLPYRTLPVAGVTIIPESDGPEDPVRGPAPESGAGCALDRGVRRTLVRDIRPRPLRQRTTEQRSFGGLPRGQRSAGHVRSVVLGGTRARGRSGARTLVWVWTLLEFGNGAGHLALAWSREGYFPGVATAPLLLLFAAWLTILQIRSSGHQPALPPDSSPS